MGLQGEQKSGVEGSSDLSPSKDFSPKKKRLFIFSMSIHVKDVLLEDTFPLCVKDVTQGQRSNRVLANFKKLLEA